MKKINCMLIGLGNIGINYDISNSNIQTHAKALVNHKGFNLLCGIDNSYLARQKFKKKYQILAYSSICQVPFKKIDLVTISTPTNTHYKIVKKVKLHYPKAFILLEKPISYNIKEASKILKACSRNKLIINYHRLYQPSSFLIKKIIEKYKKKFNLPIKVKVIYTKNIIHNCSHFFNLLKFWLGDILDSKIIKIKKISEDYRGDLLVNYKKAQVQYLSNNNLFHSQVEIKFKDKIIKYKKDGEKILLYKIIKNKTFFHKNIKNDMKFSQLNVYKEIYKYICGKKIYNICFGANAFGTLEDIFHILTRKPYKN